MLKTRIITALGLVLLMLAALFLFPVPLWVGFSTCLIGLALWEYARMVRMPFLSQMLYFTLSLGGSIFFWKTGAHLPNILHIGILVFWLVLVPLWLVRRWPLPQGLGAWCLGWLLMFPAWLALIEWRPDVKPETAGKLLMLMGIVWIADIAAYFTGKTWGRRKIAHLISPGKTWEGVYGAVAAVLIYAYLIFLTAGLNDIPSSWPLIAILLTAVAVIGDLLESWFKRCAHIKDSSRLLPGHGGVYDRIDGLIAVLAVSNALHVLNS